jgi:hypothetical protein
MGTRANRATRSWRKPGMRGSATAPATTATAERMQRQRTYGFWFHRIRPGLRPLRLQLLSQKLRSKGPGPGSASSCTLPPLDISLCPRAADICDLAAPARRQRNTADLANTAVASATIPIPPDVARRPNTRPWFGLVCLPVDGVERISCKRRFGARHMATLGSLAVSVKSICPLT